ncbi:MAG: hypothetical protein AB9873_00870 [Syntrophobacteraceae bacterium]
MKRHWISLGLVLLVAMPMLSALNPAAAQGLDQVGSADVGTDSNPVGPPQITIPGMYQPVLKERLTAAAVRGTPVYFTPQDENTSATVLFVYNTGTAAATVGLQSFDLDGSIVIDTTFSVPSKGLVRICSDIVITTALSWQAAVVVDFRTTSTYAKLTLPRGVKAEGYIVYSIANTYDPLTDASIIPLRFSVNTNTVP